MRILYYADNAFSPQQTNNMHLQEQGSHSFLGSKYSQVTGNKENVHPMSTTEIPS